MSTTPKLEKKLLPKWVWKAVNFLGIHVDKLLYCERSLKNFPKVRAKIPLSITKASDEDIQFILKRMNIREQKYARYSLKQRNTCYIAKHEGRIAGFSWVSKEGIHLHHRMILSFSGSKAYTHHSYVFPEFRRKKVFQKLTQVICRNLKKEGYVKVCNLIFPGNTPSIKARIRLGYKCVSLTILSTPIKSIIFTRRKHVHY